MFFCQICNQKFVNAVKFSNHLRNCHNMKSKEYYDNFLKKPKEEFCNNSNCENETKYYGLKKGYSDYCCKKCALSDSLILNKKKETCLEKWGHVCTLQNNSIKIKTKKTWLKNHGVDNPFKSNSIKEKIKKKKLKLYEIEHFNNREKSKETCLKKYGVENVQQNDSIKEKREKTNEKKYGYSNPLLNEKVKEKSKETCLKKYGVDNPFKSNSIKEKIKNYYNSNFQVNHYSKIHIKNYNDLIKEKWEKNFIKDGKFLIEECLRYHGITLTTALNYKNEFKIRVPNKLNKNEREISELIVGSEINTRKVIPPFELDIFSKENNLAIEFNGLMFHSYGKSQYNHFNNHLNENKNYHLNKTELCEKQNIQLIHIFENEWLNKREIWESIIFSKIGKNKRIYARKCIIKEIDNKIKNQFLEENHIQGADKSSIKLGLFNESDLVSVMTFGRPRFNRNYEWELIRFCNKKFYTVVGGASKLLKYFEKNYNPKNLITYANRRYSNGNLYKKLEFKFIKNTKPNYFYFKSINKLYSRNSFQKHKLKEKLENFDSNLTEQENMFNNGFRRIWDCGNKVFIKEYKCI